MALTIGGIGYQRAKQLLAIYESGDHSSLPKGRITWIEKRLPDLRAFVASHGTSTTPDPSQSTATVPATVVPLERSESAVDLSTLSPYMSQDSEQDKLVASINAGLNVGIKGPTGCGKTHLVQWVARRVNAELFEIVGDGGVMREDVIGTRGYDGVKTHWIDGTVTRALRRSKDRLVILYVDEPNRLRDEIQGALFPAMDHRRRLVLPENDGEIVQAQATKNGSNGLVTISSWNDGYRGTSALDEAYSDRYEVGITLGYLDPAREKSLLQTRTGVAAEAADRMAKVAQRLRKAMADKTLRTPISTRSLLAWAQLVSVGFDMRTAGQMALVEKVSSLQELERQTIWDTIVALTNGPIPAGA